jgi:glycosyltransferase involved in cell wall biosynthesis
LVKLTLTLRRLKVDAVLAYFIKPVIYATLAAWLAGVPRRYCLIEGAGYVFSEHEAPIRHRALLRWAVTQLYRLALSRAERVFFLNRDDIDLFQSEAIIAPGKAAMIGAIGVDLAHWAKAEPVLEPIVFILVARLLREKGIHEFAAAARLMRTKYPQTRFLLVGGRDSNPASLSESEVVSWVDEGILEWTGVVADVRTCLARASVFVLPSFYREGVPRSLQEAMAMGRPVITTDTPGCRDTVVEGRNGFLVPARNVDALVAAMTRFVETPGLIASMGEESRHLAEARFDVHQANRILLDGMLHA